MKRGALAMTIALLALLGACLAASPASAKSPVYNFEAKPSLTQAGGHPDIYTYFDIGNRYTQQFPSMCFCESAKNIRIGTPPGVIGNPHAVPKCALSDFITRNCTPDAQIGVIVVGIGGYEGTSGYLLTPLYNLEPRSGQAGLIGFLESLLATPTLQDVSARTDSDYGLDVTVEGLTQFAAPHEVTQVLWGVPADPIHDALRYPVGSIGSLCVDEDGEYFNPSPFIFGEGAVMPEGCQFNTPPFKPTKSNAPLKPFLSNPTTCEVELHATIDTSAYDGGLDHAESSWPPTIGCDQLGFNPSLSAVPTATQTDTASGVDVRLSVPQGDSPNVPSASQIKAATVTLPEGFTINANAADGKTACTNSEASFGSREPARCPEFSKVGTVEIESSALPGRSAAASTSATRCPATATASSSPPTASGPASNSRERSGPARIAAGSRSPSKTFRRARSPNSTSTSSAPSEACSRPRPSAGPMRSRAPSSPGTAPFPTRARPSSSTSRPARTGGRARARRGRSAPRCAPGPRTTPRAPSPRSRC